MDFGRNGLPLLGFRPASAACGKKSSLRRHCGLRNRRSFKSQADCNRFKDLRKEVLQEIRKLNSFNFVFSKGKIEIHLALLLVEIFQFTHKILLEVIKAGKTQLFAKAQDGRRRGVGHFCQTAGGIFGNFHPMRQNIGGQRFFPFRKFFLKRKFVHDQHCDSPFRFFCKHIISCSIWQKNLRPAKTPPRQQMTRRRRYSGRSAYLPSISWAVLQMVAASRP